MTHDRVAVIAPVYRNAATLAQLAARLAAALPGDWSLRLVVDACPEGSAAAATTLAAADPRVRVSVLDSNVGQHRALVHGLLVECDASAWVCMDADLQDPPEAVPLLLNALSRGGVSGVFAGRRGRYESAGRRLTGSVHRRLMAAVTGLPSDAGAFLVLDRALRDGVLAAVLQDGAPSIVGAAAMTGLPLRSVPVLRAERPIGTSAWTSSARLRQGFNTLRWVLRRRLATLR